MQEKPADLTRHNCLRYVHYPYGDEWHFIGPDGKAANARVTGNLLTSSGEALRLAALAGEGLFLSPGFLTGEDLEAGNLVSIMPEYQPVEFALNAIYRHRQHLPAKVRSFIDLLTERIVLHRHWMHPGQ